MTAITPPPGPQWVRADVLYPESDGEPMGETDFHIGAIIYLREALRYFLRDDPTAYVAANMLVYYDEGDPHAFKVPDVFVVKGIQPYDRRTYKLWAEQMAPCVVIEITSRSARLEDTGTKRALYEMLGVGEYYLFDPLDEYLRPRFQGLRLVRGRYEPMPLRRDGTLVSEALGAVLRPDDQRLRVVDPATGTVVPTLAEALYLARVEAERAEVEAAHAHAAEAEAARLRDELDRLRGQAGQGTT